MAASKKKSAAPIKAAAKTAIPSKSAKGKAPAAPGGRSKLWMIPVAMLVVALGVLAFVVQHARYLASLKFDMVREARTIPQGHDRGQGTGLANVSGDKQGQMFMLESNGVDPVRLQRFDRLCSPDSLIYKPAKAGQDLKDAVDVDCDAQGNVYVVLQDGRVQILDNNLVYLRTLATGIVGASAASVDSLGRVYVADQPHNKVVFFDAKGQRAGEIGGADGIHLVSPAHMRVTIDDEIVVIENTETGLRGRIFAKDHSLRKTFLVDKIQNAPPIRLGVNGQRKAFFNDPQGSHGIVCWDLATGKYFGEAQMVKDGEQFISPGCIGADRFTPSVYVHTVTGLIKCELPNSGGEAAEEK